MTTHRHTTNHQDLWRSHALCLDSDPELWFPDNGTARDAREICAACPVRDDCLRHALAVGEHHGIWGGASERVRRHLRRLLTRCPHPDRVQGPPACSCRYCRAVGEHETRMILLAAGIAKSKRLRDAGPGARHATAARYARGCRCEPCRDAMRASRRRNAQLRRRGEAS